MNAMSLNGWYFFNMWNWNPGILIGTAVFLGAYLLIIKQFGPNQPNHWAKMAWFGLGTLVILFALISPLDRLADEYLFSAHMVQHLLLAMAAPPLLLLGIPNWMVGRIIRKPGIRRIGAIFTKPVVCFLLFNINFLVWHFQGLYEATLKNETLHIFEHFLFMFTGVLNWWAILSPTSNMPKLGYPGQILYLFLEVIPSTILGAVISFAPIVLYPTYASAPRIFNLNPMDDQQIAGLVMAIPAGMIYMVAFSIIFFKWLNSENQSIERKENRIDLRK
jgi:putative membrane protein